MRALVLLALALPGCVCGGADVSNTLATDYDGTGYNGHWTEQCGPNMDTWGTWNLYGDGLAWMLFGFSGHGFQGIDLDVEVGFPTGLLAPGTTIGLDQLSGGAFINPGISLVEDAATLTAGTIEVRSGWEGDDVCAEPDGPAFRLKWDLTFGDGAGPTYALHGTDGVRFDTFLSEDCGGGY